MCTIIIPILEEEPEAKVISQPLAREAGDKHLVHSLHSSVCKNQ